MPEWIADEAGERVDVFITRQMAISRGAAQRLLESGYARVNDAIVKANLKLRAGDRIVAEHPEPKPARVEAEPIPLAVVYEDEDVIVIDKPRGMVVHPAPGSWDGTLVNAVLAHAVDLSGIGGEVRPGIVHRLDKDTSGLLVIAKNDRTHLSLQAQIQAKTAERKYQAILWGVPSFTKAEIDAPIGRHPVDRKKMAVLPSARTSAREATTELTVLEPLGAFCLAEARLRTGRTHQIRVHCAYAGHPVVGDSLYGGLRKLPSQGIKAAGDRACVEAAIGELGGQALHAYRLEFDHPGTGARLSFETLMPEVMQNLLDVLRDVY